MSIFFVPHLKDWFQDKMLETVQVDRINLFFGCKFLRDDPESCGSSGAFVKRHEGFSENVLTIKIACHCCSPKVVDPQVHL